MIDSSFVLRILLEYYKRERYNKYKKLKDLYFSDPNKVISLNNKDRMYYQKFHSIKIALQKIFTNLTELEYAEIYTNAFIVGVTTLIILLNFFLSLKIIQQFNNNKNLLIIIIVDKDLSFKFSKTFKFQILLNLEDFIIFNIKF